MGNSNQEGNRSLIILSFIAIYGIWGSTYLFNKVLVAQLPPFLLSGSRFVIAAVLVFVYALLTGRRTPITGQKIANATVAGFLFLTLGNGCLVYALQFVDSGFAALLVASLPLVMILMMYFLRGTPIGGKSFIGVILGFIGIYLLVSQKGLSVELDNWKGYGAVMVSVVGWAYASLFVKDRDLPADSLLNTAIQMLLGGGLMVIISLLTEDGLHVFLHLDVYSWLSFGFLIVFGSIIALTAFNYLLLHVSPEKVSTASYVNPVVALLLGWLVLDELVTSQSLMAAALLLTGVYFVNTHKHK